MASTAPGTAPDWMAGSALDQRVLGKLATAFVERLPMGIREMRALLASDGCPVECHELADVVRYYRARGARAPFRIVRFGGMELAVSSEQARLGGQVGAAAVRMVQHWGIVSVQALAERTESVSAAIIPRRFVEKIVAAFPDTEWLDQSAGAPEWFSFRGRSSGLLEALHKAMALERTFSLADLRAALARSSTAVSDAPLSVFERYLVDLGGCVIEDDRVSRPLSAARPEVLSKAELTLVRILRDAGGRLDSSALRRRASAEALPDATLTRLLRFSPLVTRAASGDEICLLGTDEGTRATREVPASPAPRRREERRARVPLAS